VESECDAVSLYSTFLPNLPVGQDQHQELLHCHLSPVVEGEHGHLDVLAAWRTWWRVVCIMRLKSTTRSPRARRKVIQL
jgi:hypothetical protein